MGSYFRRSGCQTQQHKLRRFQHTHTETQGNLLTQARQNSARETREAKLWERLSADYSNGVRLFACVDVGEAESCAFDGKTSSNPMLSGAQVIKFTQHPQAQISCKCV